MRPRPHVPLCDLTRQTAALQPQLMAAVGGVLSAGRFILGPEVDAFEQEMAVYLGARHAIGVASGTDALWLALKALGIGPGDRVLTTAFTFFGTVSAIIHAGAEPVFADVDPQTFNLDPDAVEGVLTGRSRAHQRLNLRPGTIKALIAVHLFGQAADMGALLALAREHGLFVVEDAAQAVGAEFRGQKVGTIGDLGCFSLYPTKNLGALGDAGLVVTNDDDLARRLRLLRAQGAAGKYVHETIGTNSRLDALQAALLRVKLPHLNAWIAARQELADYYDRTLRGTAELATPSRAPDRTHTFHQYVVRVSAGRRDALRHFLEDRGVETAVHYPLPVHQQPALSGLGYTRGDVPVAEQASGEVLSLPIFPGLTPDEQSWVVASIRTFPSEIADARSAASRT